MTTDEARYVASIMTNADSGCPTCAERLMAMLAKKYPEHKAVIVEVYKKNFESDPEFAEGA